MLIAAAPVIEIRGAIPFAQGVLGMDPVSALAWAFLGNLVPVVVLLKYLGPLSAFLSRRVPLCHRFFDWLFARTRRRSDVIRRYGPLGLVLFVSVPLPVTGGWTGAIAAFLLGISFHRAFPAITLGILVAGIVVTLAVTGTLSVLEVLV
ncbi:MAG: small multi-drug export protein [Candidatus Desulforudis sp.]|nr:small multi-drug export protein [Desulforudis sp.]